MGRQDSINTILQTVTPCSDATYSALAGLALGSEAAQEKQRLLTHSLRAPLEVATKKVGIVMRLVPGAFYAGKYPVTQAQWNSVMTDPKQQRSGPLDHPVTVYRADEAFAFLERLCKIEGVRPGTYTLPRGWLWTMTCRAGTRSRYYTGDSVHDRDRAGWFTGGAIASFFGSVALVRAPIGQKAPNAFGMYDMLGNVYEWCSDSVSFRSSPGSYGRAVIRRYLYKGGQNAESDAHREHCFNSCTGFRIFRFVSAL